MKVLSPNTLAAPSPHPAQETLVWRGIRGVWRPLHGSFFEHGLSVEWHDFVVDRDMDWARSFHLKSLEICLNFSGTAELHDGTAVRAIGANQLALYTTQSERMHAVRHSDCFHRFITLELSAAFLQSHFAPVLDDLKPSVRRFIAGRGQGPAFLEILPLPATMLAARTHFIAPPVPEAARDTWYLGRILEILAQTLLAGSSSRKRASAFPIFCA